MHKNISNNHTPELKILLLKEIQVTSYKCIGSESNADVCVQNNTSDYEYRNLVISLVIH